MATASENDCLNDPNFAVICNFLDRFGEIIGLGDISYTDLQTWLEDTKHVPSFLVDLHVKLLRRMGKSSVSTDKWERYVIKFIHTYSSVDAWEVERFGYKHCKIATKLTILKNLLEKQFDFNSKFKEQINAKPAEDMRFEPLGRDRNGLAYWYLIDKEFNVRVYREDQDDIDAETWEVVCKNRNDLAELIDSLEDQIAGNEVKEDSESEAVSLTENTNGAVKKEEKVDSAEEEVNGSSTVKKEPDKMDEVDGATEEKDDNTEEKKNVDAVKCESKDPKQKVKVEVKSEDSVQEEKNVKMKEEPHQEVKLENSVKVEESSTKEEKIKDKEISVKSEIPEEQGGKEEKGGNNEDTVTVKLEKTDIKEERPTKIDMQDRVEEAEIKKEESTDVDACTMSKAEEAEIPKENELADTSHKGKEGAPDEDDHSKGGETGETKTEKSVEASASGDEPLETSASGVKDTEPENSKTDGMKKGEQSEVATSVKETRETDTSGSNVSVSSNDKAVGGENREQERLTGTDTVECTDNKTTEADKTVKCDSVKEKGDPEDRNSNNIEPNEANNHSKSSTVTENKTEIDTEKEDILKKDDSELKLSPEKNVNDTYNESKEKAPEEESHKEEEKVKLKDNKDLKDSGKEDKSGNIPEKSPATKLSGDGEVESPNSESKETQKTENKETKENTQSDVSAEITERETQESTENGEAGTVDANKRESNIEVTSEEAGKGKHDQTSEKPDLTSNKSEVSTEKPDHTTDKSDITSSKSQQSAEKPDHTTDKSDVTSNKSEVSTEKPDHTTDKSDITSNKSQQSAEKPDHTTDKSEDSTEKKKEKNDDDSENKSAEKTEESTKESKEAHSENDSNALKLKEKTKKPNLKGGRKRGIEYEESAEDSPVEPNSKKAKDGKKIIPRGKRRTPKKVDSSSDSDDVPLSKIGAKNGDSNRKRPESSPNVPSRKSNRPVKKKKISSEEEDESPKKTKSKRKNNMEKGSDSEEEGSPAPKKNSKKSKPPTKKTKKQEPDSSDEDVPLKNTKNAKNKPKPKSEEAVPSDEDDQGRRRSARVRNMRQRKEPTPEPSSFEEDNVDSEFEIGSEQETTDDEFTPTKGRNAQRQEARKRQLEEDEAEEDIPNDTPCCKCQKTHQPEWLLLCDKCDAAFHTACLRPPLMIIPDGDWYCPPCEHKSLVTRLQENLKDLDTNLKKHERIIKRKQRLAYVGISLDNILKEEYKERKENIAPEEEYESEEESRDSFNPKPRKSKYIKRSCRQRNTISYKFEDFDDLIDKAIKQEVEEVKEYKKHNYGRSRGKDMANIYEAEGREYVPSDEEKSDKPPPVVSRKKRARRLTTLDSDDDNDEGDESEEFHLSDETVSEVPEEEQEDSEDDEDEVSDYSEDGEGWRSCRRSSRYGKPTRRSSRKRGRHSIFKDFVVDEDEDSEDNRRTARRSVRKRATYRDPSSEEEEETEEETEESFDSEDLCSEDSDTKNKKGKQKNDITKKKKIESNSETEEESDESRTKKKFKPSKKKAKKKVEESESDSEDDHQRRSRRNVKKIDFKSLMLSETESEDGGKSSKKKKKISSSESDVSDETGSESENEEVVKKKKNVIRDESSGTDEYEPEEKESKEDKSEANDKNEDAKPKDKVEEKIDETSVDSSVVNNTSNNNEQTENAGVMKSQETPLSHPNVPLTVTSEHSSAPVNRRFEDQGIPPNMPPQQENMFPNFPNIPQVQQNVGFQPPGQQFPNQRPPFPGMERPSFHPQPGPLKSPPHVPSNPPSHPHIHNQRHISSPSQGMSSPPPFQNRMVSPPHQMTSPSHNQAPPHNQMNQCMPYPSNQMGLRSGDPQRFPIGSPPVPSSQATQMPFDLRMNPNRMPMDFRGPHPRMMNSSNSYPQYGPNIGNVPPGSQATNFQNQMRMHGPMQSRMEGPGQMEPVTSSPGGPLTSLGQMVAPGYQSQPQQMPRQGVPPNSMNMGMPRHNMPQTQQKPHGMPPTTATPNTGMLPNTQGQHMPPNLPMHNMPHSGSQGMGFNMPGQGGMPPAYPGQTPSFNSPNQGTAPPSAETPKTKSKRGRPKGSKTKKKKDAPIENDDSSKSPGSSPQVDPPKLPFPASHTGEMDQRQMHPAGVPEGLQRPMMPPGGPEGVHRPMMPGNENRSKPPPYVHRNEASQRPPVSHVPPSDFGSRPPDSNTSSTEASQRVKDSEKRKNSIDSDKGPVDETNPSPASNVVVQKTPTSEGSSKQAGETEVSNRSTSHRPPPMGLMGQRPPGPEIGHRPHAPEIGHRPHAPEIGHRPHAPEIGHRPHAPEIGHRPHAPEIGHRPHASDMGSRLMVPTSGQMGQPPMPPQFSEMGQRPIHPGMMPPRMMDPRGMMMSQGHPVRAPMPYPGYHYNREHFGINGHPASVHSSLQDPGFPGMNPPMMSSPHQNPIMHPSQVAQPLGGGRGFMIDNLLEKNQKSGMSSFSENMEEGGSNAEESKADPPQMEQEYGSGFQGDQEEEGVSDIADIVKCFKA
ncbi:remodeling and spacing factor 1-like [Saccostrea cucullata]|uniref:remodeling and spacing factor 1-like n=1 Tax=Saccostrea cuccullata TaxID=36930 RepID=UPI002ED60D1A